MKVFFVHFVLETKLQSLAGLNESGDTQESNYPCPENTTEEVRRKLGVEVSSEEPGKAAMWLMSWGRVENEG